ncbi:MAG: dehydrogenase [Planctomycetes bacterium RBG_16_64_12]|nr:MAG: dehydrogenase [Planctomycetes bacterium RBG_16_64_12]
MPPRANRRQFMQTAAATGVGFWVAGGLRAEEGESPNERIGMASVGIGGKGSSDSADAGNSGDMVAICDIDTKRLEAAQERFPKAKLFTDFRKMLEEMDKSIDAVTVSTPDHCHAPAGLMAMRMGKHCFCQKPMTHSIYEARLMGQVAKEKGVATEMGNQGTAEDGLRKAAALVQAGALGAVSEVHVWTNRPIWPQGGDRPEPEECPDHIEWDLWLGPAPERPYAQGYHPFSWRGWWDFGTGALGDMACHTLNMPFAALDLRDPISVQAVTSGHNKDSYPKWSIITYEFAANDSRPAVKLFWYDGGKRPDKELLDGKTPSGSGCAIIGEKGKIYSPDDYGAQFEILGAVELPEVEFEKSPGHFAEWVRAIKGGPPAMSNFPDYASPLTETVLLGNLAVWVAAAEGEGEKVEWDAQNMKATNVAGLETIIKPEYREGYTLDA